MRHLMQPVALIHSRRFARCAALVLLALLAGACGREETDRTEDGRVIVQYWEKWTGFEGEAMDAVVNDFNASQTNIWVERLTVSDIARKMMLATAGGNPPDIAGLWSHNVPTYAEKGALTPLDGLVAASGISSNDYIPLIWDLCRYRGFHWALPSTPASIALHWNKQMFREAGLDPDQPPRTLAELDRMAEQLTVVEVVRAGHPVRVRFTDLTPEERAEKNFTLLQLGYSPSEPGWWNSMWGYWFGASLWDGDRRLTARTPENLAALTWYRSYVDRYGLDNLQKLGSSFGNFSSPQNSFLSGKVAMVLQGVWMYNFIDKYAPTIEWGAAPFPSADTVRWPEVTIVECDVLVVPRGARHVAEAFAFIRYVNQPAVLEKLCLGQRKFSPLREVSAEFLRSHPNPHIRVFMNLAASPQARAVPPMTVWNEFDDEMRIAYDRVQLGLVSPADALEEAQRRVQWKFDRVMRRWDLIKDERMREWQQ
jgi:multiple sugar transport system substrate-binding protein